MKRDYTGTGKPHGCLSNGRVFFVAMVFQISGGVGFCGYARLSLRVGWKVGLMRGTGRLPPRGVAVTGWDAGLWDGLGTGTREDGGGRAGGRYAGDWPSPRRGGGLVVGCGLADAPMPGSADRESPEASSNRDAWRRCDQ